MMNHYRYRQENNGPLLRPTVYRLASERRYGEIPAHVRTNPQDIYWTDRYGSTALHVLCCSCQLGSPLERAIDSIIQQDPSLVGQPNEASWTPLHLVCEKRLLWRTNIETVDLILRLVAACPSAVSVRLQGGFKAKTPFHTVCETNGASNVLRAMLSVNPSLAIQVSPPPSNRPMSLTVSQTPLELLWSTQQKDQEPTQLGNSFEKMEVLLRAIYWGNIMEMKDYIFTQTSFPIVCAVCSIRCPRDYVSRILSIHSQQISIPDPKTGYLPLHYAIMSAEEADTTAYTSFLMEQIIEEYPEASQVPFRHGGKVLPLHVLVADRGMTWHKGGVQQLALASVDVLTRPDPRSRLVPALESASHAHTSRMHLSTTYELLRLAPQVLQAGFF